MKLPSLHISKGIWYMIWASFAFALMGVFVKRLGRDFDTVEIVLFRNLLGVLFILISLFQKPFTLRGLRPTLLIFRGFIGTISLYAFSYNLTHVSLGEAFTYYQTSALFVALLSYFFLNERLNLPTWSGLLIGFLGIIVIFRPDLSNNLKNNCIGLANGLFSASAYLAVSELKKHYDTRAIVLTFMGWGILLPILSMCVGSFYTNTDLDFILCTFKMPQIKHIFDILMVGVAALVGQIYATRAYGAEHAGVVSAISFSNVIFSIGLGILFTGDKIPDTLTFVGMGMILVSGLLVSLFRGA